MCVFVCSCECVCVCVCVSVYVCVCVYFLVFLFVCPSPFRLFMSKFPCVRAIPYVQLLLIIISFFDRNCSKLLSKL